MTKNFPKILLSLSLLFLLSCGEKNKDTLVIGTKLDGVISLDPAEAFEIHVLDYLDNTYTPLVACDPKNPELIIGVAAESWVVSDDKRKITFKIRPGIKFASGNTLTAHDVAFSLQRTVILKKNPSEIISQFGFTEENVKEKIRALDDETLVFEMDDSYAPTLVLYCLTANSGAGIVDQKEVMKHEVDGDMGHLWLKTNHAGSGPFKLKSWKPKESISVESHKDHFWGAPKIDKMVFQHIGDDSSSILMLEKGDIDILKGFDLTSEQIGKVRENIRMERVSQGVTRFLMLNQKVPELQIPEVRQAIRHLIDYNGIVNTQLKGEAFVHQTFIPMGFFGALDENPYDYNIEKAQALLDKVGLRNKLTFTLESQNSEQAQALQSSFSKGGITLKISLGDTKQLLTKYRERRYEMGLSFWIPDYFDPHNNAATFGRNPDNSDAAKSKTILWRTGWVDPELDKIVMMAKKEENPEKRKNLYYKLQRKLLDSSIINMFQYDRILLIRDNVQGIVFSSGSNKVFYKDVHK
jgi:peptide/nickel transport system substrate-binding protein